MMNDELCVVHPRAAGLDIHKGHIMATVRLSEATAGPPRCETRMFSALASGLAALVAWLTSHRVVAAAMEATGVYWHTPWQALTDAGIKAQLLHAHHVKQLRGRKTDVEDSRWLARVCQFGLGRPSFVPSQQFRDLRALSRHRRKLVARRAQVRNQAQKVVDRGGVRIGAVLSDIFGRNGRRILDGLVARRPSTDILASLSAHVRGKLAQLGDALRLALRETERRLLADLLSDHDTLSRRVDDFDRHLDEALAPWTEQLRLLETLPGIDHAAACAILSETGADPHRVFGNAHRLAAWAGLCPGNNESAGKRRTGRTRRGNQTLRTVLIECAHAAARTHNCQFQTYHQTMTHKAASSAPSSPPPTSCCDASSRCCAMPRPTATRIPTTRRCSFSATRRAGYASCISSTFSSATTTAPAQYAGRLPQTEAPSRRTETAIPHALAPGTVRAEATWGSLVRRASPGGNVPNGAIPS